MSTNINMTLLLEKVAANAGRARSVTRQHSSPGKVFVQKLEKGEGDEMQNQ